MGACHVLIPTDTRNTSHFATAKSSITSTVILRKAALTTRTHIVPMTASSKIKIDWPSPCSRPALAVYPTCDTVMVAGPHVRLSLHLLRTSLVIIALSASRAKTAIDISRPLHVKKKLGASLVLRGKAEVAVLSKSTAPWIRLRMQMTTTKNVSRTSLPPNTPHLIKYAAEVRSIAGHIGTTLSNRPPKRMHKTSTSISIKTGMTLAAMSTPQHIVNRHQIRPQLAANRCAAFQTNHWSSQLNLKKWLL